jgi:hypothetical protein
MAKLFDCITEELQTFIAAQPLFFVATAPLSESGHINLSPKGLDCFRVVSPHQVAYLDLTGSGNETSAHLLENGRITFLFCAFQAKPLILRLYGQGRVVIPTAAEWPSWAAQFPPLPGTRQIVVADIDRVQTSCGLGVPLLAYTDQRQELLQWADNKGESGIRTYQAEKNQHSLDGLPTPLATTLEDVARNPV